MPSTHDQFMGMVILLAFCLALYEAMDAGPGAAKLVSTFVVALLVILGLTHFATQSGGNLMTKFSKYTQALSKGNS